MSLGIVVAGYSYTNKDGKPGNRLFVKIAHEKGSEVLEMGSKVLHPDGTKGEIGLGRFDGQFFPTFTPQK